MSKTPLVIETLKDLKAQIWEWRGQGETIGFVPTMGALHEGHLSLVTLARQHATKTIASIYVNPTQFAPNEDLATYPRSLESDIEKLAQVNCDLVYAPRDSLYAEDHATSIYVSDVGEGLETNHRPTFFHGVALIVLKLFNRVTPDVAIFGEKDYQQLCIIRQMVRDLDLPIEIIGGPIIRGEGGIALSSRNSYLDDTSLPIAQQLNKIMFACAHKIEQGAALTPTLEATKTLLGQIGFEAVDYLELVDAHSLAPITKAPFSKTARLLVVARCQGIRLLDNCAVTPVKPPF